jgi:hypothetical protein
MFFVSAVLLYPYWDRFHVVFPLNYTDFLLLLVLELKALASTSIPPSLELFDPLTRLLFFNCTYCLI